jgi:hypothetical protein
MTPQLQEIFRQFQKYIFILDFYDRFTPSSGVYIAEIAESQFKSRL